MDANSARNDRSQVAADSAAPPQEQQQEQSARTQQEELAAQHEARWREIHKNQQKIEQFMVRAHFDASHRNLAESQDRLNLMMLDKIMDLVHNGMRGDHLRPGRFVDGRPNQEIVFDRSLEKVPFFELCRDAYGVVNEADVLRKFTENPIGLIEFLTMLLGAAMTSWVFYGSHDPLPFGYASKTATSPEIQQAIDKCE